MRIWRTKFFLSKEQIINGVAAAGMADARRPTRCCTTFIRQRLGLKLDPRRLAAGLTARSHRTRQILLVVQGFTFSVKGQCPAGPEIMLEVSLPVHLK